MFHLFVCMWMYYIKHFFSVCDVVPVTLYFDGTTIVRDVPTDITVYLNITNAAGAHLPPIGAGLVNFDLEVYLSDTRETKGIHVGTQHWLATLYNQHDNSGVDVNGILEMRAMEFKANISADVCMFVQYLCVNITQGDTAGYWETNISNNIICEPISAHLTCQPGMLCSISI